VIVMPRCHPATLVMRVGIVPRNRTCDTIRSRALLEILVPDVPRSATALNLEACGS
jgi:hypothetical protein